MKEWEIGVADEYENEEEAERFQPSLVMEQAAEFELQMEQDEKKPSLTQAMGSYYNSNIIFRVSVTIYRVENVLWKR